MFYRMSTNVKILNFATGEVSGQTFTCASNRNLISDTASAGRIVDKPHDLGTSCDPSVSPILNKQNPFWAPVPVHFLNGSSRRELQACEHDKSSLQTQSKKPHAPRDQVR